MASAVYVIGTPEKPWNTDCAPTLIQYSSHSVPTFLRSTEKGLLSINRCERLRCLQWITPLLRNLLLPALLLLLLGASARAQISPGSLSKAHESLTGTSQCASCHIFGASTPTFKCLDCHKEIAKTLAEKHGYHFNLQMQNPQGKDCVRCHLEHNGATFNLIHWEVPFKQFDHRLTGYPLTGKHALLDCQKCHTPANIQPTARSLLQRKDLSKSYMGLSQTCITCHVDYHKGQLGKDCESCHNTSDWKAAKQIDHSKTRYPLTGMHLQVACEKCHKPDAPGGVARFKDMKFGTCSACHVDPHHGEFKETCENCHTTAGWKKLPTNFAFDHSKTKFPLLGKHADVPCASCHTGADFKKPLPFVECADCHKPDPHRGQFVGRPAKGECAECHNVNGWKPSLFGVKEHATSKYPLEGMHAKVECAKCHLPAGKDTVYQIKFAQCLDCHKDEHDKQFAAKPYENHCEQCHTVTDFHRSIYSIAKHLASAFPLTGAHIAVSCGDCHKVGEGGRKDKTLPFKFPDHTCAACHIDPHHGEFKARMDRRRPNGTTFGCEACHNARSWTDVNGFDHSKTAFPLRGVHRTVTCGACHKAPAGQTQITFKGTTQLCEGCHKDPHERQFVGHAGTTPCASCHTERAWKPSTFDHDKRTQFPLQGGHAEVPCEECHTQVRILNGNPVVFYKPTPVKCAACHGSGEID